MNIQIKSLDAILDEMSIEDAEKLFGLDPNDIVSTEEQARELHLFFQKHEQASKTGRIKEFIDGLHEADRAGLSKAYLEGWK